MSVKLLCPKCNSEVIKLKAIGEFKVTINVDENGQPTPEIVEEISPAALNYEVIECECGHICGFGSLEQGRQSEVSGKWFPIRDLVAYEKDGKQVICTQEELDKLQAPSIDDMNEEQLREHVKEKDATMAQMQEQMAQMMAQMQELMKGKQQEEAPKTTGKGKPKAKTEAPAPAPAPQPAPTPQPTPAAAPVQEQTVDTNLPSPGSEEQDFEVINVDGGEEEFSGDLFSGEEAPF